MAAPRGALVLMGSGELTATMVEVHKELLGRLGPGARAVFLDTPAGFQLNADQISERAVAYFRERVGRGLEVASLKSAAAARAYEGEVALATLRRADYIFVGPGSPTYALRQWKETSVPAIFAERVEEGAVLAAASAAALTLGRFTLPVYEIYKVGEEPRWAEGLDLLGKFGLPVAVVPHWNNAEGGTHDTRFCYAGEIRFRALQALLPEDVAVLGIDEHTACVLDVARGVAEVRGIGRVTVRRGGGESTFAKGERFRLSLLGGPALAQGGEEGRSGLPSPSEAALREEASGEEGLGGEIRRAEAAFEAALGRGDPEAAAGALLDLDHLLWAAQRRPGDEGDLGQGREAFREMLALLGHAHGGAQPETAPSAPLVEALVALRDEWREEGKWTEADALRDRLRAAGILVEDTPAGARWRPLPGPRDPS
ncbi:MAG: Type 1 glutamine amidotransferase-like domain-containing protein [Thermodesulfobacteriota bacterium]